jgi:hypothetical protein
MSERERCETCRYYLPHGYVAAQGLCRRYPPHPADDHGDGGWVSLYAEGWCGEWESKEPHWLEREP